MKPVPKIEKVNSKIIRNSFWRIMLKFYNINKKVKLKRLNKGHN